MVWFVVAFALIYVGFYIYSNKLKINFKSFFKKGFKKFDDKFGILCYTAKMGRGKTYSAVEFVKSQLDKDSSLTCVTNCTSFFEKNSSFGSRLVLIKDFNNIIDYINDSQNCHFLIFYDEIFSYLDDHMTKKMRNFLSQLRKRKILLVTTAQEWREINLSFRKYVRFHIAPMMFSLPLTHDAFIIKEVNDGDLIHWDNDAQDFVAPRIETIFSKCSLDIANSYDTYETIN